MGADARILVANVFGLISAVAFWYSNFKKSKKQMLKVHLICNISDFLQYLLLGARSAMANTTVSFMKNLSYIGLGNSNRYACVVVFGALKITLMSLAYDNIFTIAMIVYEVASVYILLRGKTKYLLIAGIVSSAIWIGYDFVCMAYVASLLGVGSVISQSIAIIKNKGQLEGKE